MFYLSFFLIKPESFTCDVKDGRCNKGDVSLPFYVKTKSVKLTSITCQDGISQCPSQSTCCKMSSGQFACCPLPDAVCCEDHLHCCPNGYQCDVADGRCIVGNVSIPLFKKTNSIILQTNKQNENEKNKLKTDTAVNDPSFNLSSIVCPDGCVTFLIFYI